MGKSIQRNDSYNLAKYAKEGDTQERLALMGSLSTMIIHDIASPLSIINAEVREIKTSGTLPPFNMQSVKVIQTQYDFIVDLIGQFRKILSAKQSRVSTCINNLFRSHVFIMYLDRILPNNISLELKLHPGSLEVEISTMEFYQIVFNLVSNSVDAINRKRETNHSGDGKNEDTNKIFISTSLTETTGKQKIKHYAEITVIDSGTGLPKTDSDNIFDPFVTTKKNDGFGMGLSIVKNITTSLNGTLEARNIKPAAKEKETPPNWNSAGSKTEEGSIFKVRLPAKVTYQ